MREERETRKRQAYAVAEVSVEETGRLHLANDTFLTPS
jgi:hypothetical protein